MNQALVNERLSFLIGRELLLADDYVQSTYFYEGYLRLIIFNILLGGLLNFLIHKWRFIREGAFNYDGGLERESTVHTVFAYDV